MEGEAHEPECFRRGLELAAGAGGLLNHLFRVRTAGLFAEVPGNGLASYLSGIAIGHELAGAFALFRPGAVMLIGSEGLVRRYREALRRRGLAADAAPADAAAAGLRRLAGAMERAR
jgi:2-dehydro-3-deoxygalactonokinase